MSNHLDHIIWVCNDLERGCERFKELTGVTPAFGGVHASGLTQNALVSLGNRCYFEILAPVRAPGTDDDVWTRHAHSALEPHVLTYCLRSPMPLQELGQVTARLGWKNAIVSRNGRSRPDGVRLEWEWLAPIVEPFALAFPFFIDWLGSPHPSGSPAKTPREGIALRHFSVGHPLSSRLSRALAACGVSVATFDSPEIRFRVELQTPRGLVEL